MWIEEPGKIGYQSFKEIAEKLGEKKLKDLSWEDICKYLLIYETLEKVDEEIGDDAEIWFSYNDQKLYALAIKAAWNLDDLINEQILANNPLWEPLPKEDVS